MFAPQFTDYFSHFGGSTLPLCYGHKTEGIPRVLVADGIEVLLDQWEANVFLIRGVQVNIPSFENQIEI